MKLFKDPPQNTWNDLVRRPQLDMDFLDSAVRNIMDRVKRSGDQALRDLTLQYDRATVHHPAVSEADIREAGKELPRELREAIRIAAGNIEKFHAAQKRETTIIETTEGVTCWRKAVAIDKAGIYIPGGSAPLFSTVLMLAIPARIAGCREVIMCTPPARDGKIHPAILFAAHLAGVHRIFKAGGAQAIAAMTFGTESIPRVYKIFGPGNQFVTKAKQLAVEEGVAIDLPAGPSEVLVIADNSANAEFVAADLLSQAEHGEDSQVMLVSLSERLLDEVQEQVARQLQALPRRAVAERSLAGSCTVYFSKPEDAIEFVNAYAPEHLIINTENADDVAEKIINAGSVFLGNYSPEAVGDYASGTNHTLPTNGFARASAGVSLESFLKYITFQRVTEAGIRNIGPIVETMADAEQLAGHGMAIRVRLNELQTSSKPTP